MLAAFPSAVVVIYVFMPFYHRLQVYTAYEYLEKRFSVTVRSLASGIFVLWRVLWMGTAIYVPSLVLHTVTGFALIETIVAVGVVATLYTVLGGMRAVIWTDVVQFFVLFCGSILALWVVGSAVEDSPESGLSPKQGEDAGPGLVLGPHRSNHHLGSLLERPGGSSGNLRHRPGQRTALPVGPFLKVMQQSFLVNMGGGFPLGLMMISIGLGLYAFYQLNPGQLPPPSKGTGFSPISSPARCRRD